MGVDLNLLYWYRSAPLAEKALRRLAALGATVRIVAAGHQQAQVVLSQSSYYSHDDLRLHFGLGPASRVDELHIIWPTGVEQTMRDVIGDRVVTIRENKPTRQ